MKKVMVLGLVLCLLLSGCASVLNRSYASETPHPQFSDADKDSGYLRAESYQQLVSAILFLVTQGDTSGVIRLYDYTGSAESDLDAAYWEVIQMDPLGAYAVDYIKYEMTKAVSYYEIELGTIAYRRTAEQRAAVVSVTGVSAISQELMQLLGNYRQEAAYRVSYFEQSLTEADIRALVYEAYYELPAAALGRPELSVQLYPAESSGRQRLVEILLSYPLPQETLLERQEALAQRLEALRAQLKPEAEAADRLLQAQALLNETVRLSAEGGSDAYEALVLGQADSEGLSLAAKLFCDAFSIPCHLVYGTRQGEIHWWLQVQVDDGPWLHWDASLGDGALWDDAALAALGYQWGQALPEAEAGE